MKQSKPNYRWSRILSTASLLGVTFSSLPVLASGVSNETAQQFSGPAGFDISGEAQFAAGNKGLIQGRHDAWKSYLSESFMRVTYKTPDGNFIVDTKINLEFDILSKYVENIMRASQ